jgi:hypothetical protein
MKSQWFRSNLVTVGCTIAIIAGQPLALFAADAPAAAPTPLVRDVKMGPQGSLKLRVLDAQGKTLQGQQVSLRFGDKTIASAVSNQAGEVAFRGLRSGTHVVTGPHGTTAFRFWDARTAPPNSLANPALIAEGETVRGQFGSGALGPLIGTGVTIAALVVAIDAKNDASDAQDETAALRKRVSDLEAASP